MKAAVLTIGTELTRGELVDRNSAYLAERLTERGFFVTEMATVDDHHARIVATLRRLSAHHDVVLCTGGLGPTTDDRTSACAAQALGVPLVRDRGVHAELVSLLEARGRPVTASNEKQADFPEGATILKNNQGTAPGFCVHLLGAACFFMPGVPAEMQAMLENAVLPLLPAPRARTQYARLRTFGLPESEVNDRLTGLESKHGVEIGYRASNSEIEVKILSSAREHESDEAHRVRASLALEEVKRRLGESVYAEGTTRLPEALGLLLLERNATFGVAESCTGGLVSQMMTSVPGASRYFYGGVTSYDNRVKERILGVSADALRMHGAVSKEVAREMAEGARQILGVDYALSLTGIAGPSGGSPDKPVGLVHFAVATPHGTTTEERTFPGDRARIQLRAALTGLWAVRASLMS